ncbi:hypothetical protein Hdeb2414_s0028g00701091 [Helianthus debilis subsp. tardiflorus]
MLKFGCRCVGVSVTMTWWLGLVLFYVLGLLGSENEGWNARKNENRITRL